MNLQIYNFLKSEAEADKNKALGIVSINPPFFDIIVAHPLEAASIAVLPNGSSQKDGATDILVSLYNF